jgi:hypothetical protein
VDTVRSKQYTKRTMIYEDLWCESEGERLRERAKLRTTPRRSKKRQEIELPAVFTTDCSLHVVVDKYSKSSS